ncbi:MAG: META domain-containing protein [Aliivibrio sp.]|uniref:META domain-containing protein n=1 Tax=Aliivibrio sp. TaxID=1872443 RepID=UPI001A4CC651|nr:META domain-containing protein [Aliivibrio sp.]
MKKLLIAITLPLFIAACGSTVDEKQTQVSAKSLQHHHWILTEIDGTAINAPDKFAAPDLEIGENFSANGKAGCNNFFGQAELNAEGKFRIDKMGMSMKACLGDVMKTEQIVTSTLSTWSDISLTKDSLTLKDEQHQLTFKLSDWK